MSSSSSGTATEYTINGVKVHFPCKAYPSQLTMMDKIIKCIEKKQNSLLESPTGSGKSLALLCASLAWLMAKKDKVYAYQLELERSCLESEDELSQCCEQEMPVKEEKIDSLPVKDEKIDSLPVKEEKIDSLPVVSAVKEESAQGVCAKQDNVPQHPICETKESKEETAAKDIEANTQSSDDVDFQVPQKRFRTPGNQSAPSAKKLRRSEDFSDDLEDLATNESGSKKAPEWTMDLTRQGKEGSCSSSDKEATKGEEKKSVKEVVKDLKEEKKCNGNEGKLFDDGEMSNENVQVPQIFFGTRTHKQITQIVRELNKTKYNNSNMCILASRDHACIHPKVSQSKNKQEDCRKSVKGKEGKSCAYYDGVRQIRDHRDLENHGLGKTWDIEDLVSFGEKITACPYFITREILKGADIVFCPYNYLIDPIIRSQMSIDLKDQIVILDEGHNIEDSCRAAASWTVTTQELEDAMSDIDYFMVYNILPEQHRALHTVCASLRKWILDNSLQLTDSDYEKSSKVWDGNDMLKALEGLALTPKTLPILMKHFKKIMTPEDSKEQKFIKENRSLKATTTSLFGGLFMVLSYLLKHSHKFVKDYRVAIIKKADVLVSATLPGGWRRKGAFEKKWVLSLNFWCLNPAVAFSEIDLMTRSVILTSGTLSPMSTFASELGTTFPVQLEANHVVGKSQVWVSSLSVSPNGSTLNATYRYAETFGFQDELGNAIYNVCQVVPHGVLCFFPSYSMLDKLMRRWKATGLWGRLLRLKSTFAEPRRGDKSDFNDIMDDFYAAIKASEEAEEDDDEPRNGGALFLAVCRGKVSEGMDFADNNARAVITVGIPFPNVKDTQVELKRKYNNQYCSVRGLLNGNEWYEIQAYRALNQALGRCIRHKNDWGAILLIDERFGKSPKYRNGLSKWIRSKVIHYDNFQNALTSLKQFAVARRQDPSPATTLCRTPCTTPCQTPGTTMEPNESKPNPESPDSFLSNSHCCQSRDQTPTGKPTNCTESKPDPHLSIPIPNGPQLTKTPCSVFSCAHDKQGTPQLPTTCTIVRASTPVTGHVLAPKTLHFTTLNNIQTPGSAEGEHGDSRDPGWQKVLKRPLFCAQGNVVEKQDSFSLAVALEGQTVGDAGINHGSEKELSGDACKPHGVDETTMLNTDVEVGMETASVGSPVLFVTPPSSFGNSDDIMETIQQMEMDNGNIIDNDGVTEARGESMGTQDDKDIEGHDRLTAIQKTASGSKCEVVETDAKGKQDVDKDINRKQEIPCVVSSKSPVASRKTLEESRVCNNRKIDLLDIVDCEQDRNVSKAVTWNLSCSCCGATFLSGNSGKQFVVTNEPFVMDGVKPEERDIPSESFLGNILRSLFLLNNHKKKNDLPIKTVLATCDFNKVIGCCPAFNCSEGKKVKRDLKLNSIYVEEEAQCYVPLVCSHCENSRKSRSRVNVVGARAVSCGKESPKGRSLVWFAREKVELDTSTMENGVSSF